MYFSVIKLKYYFQELLEPCVPRVFEAHEEKQFRGMRVMSLCPGVYVHQGKQKIPLELRPRPVVNLLMMMMMIFIMIDNASVRKASYFRSLETINHVFFHLYFSAKLYEVTCNFLTCEKVYEKLDSNVSMHGNCNRCSVCFV